jgi:hypothetical protein
LPLLLDAFCLVHIIRTGQDRIWAYVVIMLPIVGSLIYIGVEMVPGLIRGPGGRRLARNAVAKVDPARGLRRSYRDLEMVDTVQNRLRVADHSMSLGRYEEALRLYEEAATGIHADDTALLMGMARASSALRQPARALEALDRLRAANPGFQSNEAHLIYAISLEELGRDAEAMDEYRVLVTQAPGEEARYRYAALLEKHGNPEQASILYKEILDRAHRATRRYKREQSSWIAKAQARFMDLK